MTLTPHNPQTPLANYSLGIEVPPNARWLYISGQVAVDKDGKTPPDFDAQVKLVFQNLTAVLESAQMTGADLVKVNVYLTRVEDIPALRIARDAFQGANRPASTLVVVSRLARPEWLVEIEAVAAKAR
jgi:2-iminobutanoate/2-iminopropanoate deaminase